MPGVRDRGGEVQKGSVVLECGGAEGGGSSNIIFSLCLAASFVCLQVPT